MKKMKVKLQKQEETKHLLLQSDSSFISHRDLDLSRTTYRGVVQGVVSYDNKGKYE